MSARFDLVVVGGQVVDGSGSARYAGDVGIIGDRIAAIGDLSGAATSDRLDASGAVVAPGFIDAHVHSELALLARPISMSDLHQGVTTHIVGQDGTGFAPSDPETLALVRRALGPLYDSPTQVEPASIAQFLERYDHASTVNVATLIPNGNVRAMVMGSDARTATPVELAEMTEICRQGMREGALGLSSGLDYAPSGFASTAELICLARAVAEFGGLYVSHIRYADGMETALREALQIGRESGAATHISHLRPDAPDRPASDLLDIVSTARTQGADVTFDGYPYAFGCTSLTVLLPTWILAGTQAEVTGRLRDPAARRRLREQLDHDFSAWARLELAGDLGIHDALLNGLRIDVAARAIGKEIVDFVCDLLIDNDLQVLVLGVDDGDDFAIAQVKAMLSAEAHLACSDAIYARGRTHPRRTGAFARFVGDFVRGRDFLSLESAVHHATRASAVRHGLFDRGLIDCGMVADITIFDAETFGAAPGAGRDGLATGMRHVVVNGEVALRAGTVTGALPGRGLRRTRAHFGHTRTDSTSY
ncbi:N-acyl-D-amino-acid deacylase family protein [Microbacterium sp. MC2]